MGSSSSTTETMCVIYDLSYLEMTLNVDELDILDIAVGQKAEITADAIDDQTFEGIVTSISSAGTTTGGTTTANGSTVAVRGAKEILVLVRVAVIYDEARRDATALTRSLAALPSDYDALLARHAPLHGAMFNRARLSLDGAEADHRLPAQALFAKSTLDQPLPALLEKQFDACRYLILSSSGPEFPPTLQGIWGGTFSPAWSSG